MPDGFFAETYHLLPPDQRLAALSAAAARGDEADHRLLTATAPRVAVPVPHHVPLAVAWQTVALLARCAALDAAAELWLTLARAAAPAGPDEQARRQAELAAQSTALAAQATAWRALCQQFGIEVDALAAGLPGGATMSRAEELAGRFADAAALPASTAAALGGLRAALRTALAVWDSPA